jgi:SAM-dependent methyltransferase
MRTHTQDATALREEIIRLGPWSLDVQVSPEVSTRVALDAPPGTYPASFGKIHFGSPRSAFRSLLARLYPSGLDGRSVLDCACNCGGFSFWAKEFGAGRCYGFDVRKHWINQANFLLANRTEASDGIRFEVGDLYDITIFKGIFYHLPDPISGLRVAADLTRELILVNTATRNGIPDGMLVLSEEHTEAVMSGVYGLNWLPTGPNVVIRILRWMGFAEARCVWWQQDTSPSQPPEMGRMEVIAARTPGFFEKFDRSQAIASPPAGSAQIV